MEPVKLPPDGETVYVDRQRPFQKFCGEYLFATSRIATLLSSVEG